MLSDKQQPLDGLRKLGITNAKELLSYYIAGDEIINNIDANADINSLALHLIEWVTFI